MKICFSVVSLLLLITGTLTQDDFGFDLSDALDDATPATPVKPKEEPKAPEKPKDGGELDLLDAFGADDPPTEKPKPKPTSGDLGGFGFDLEDALKPGPSVKPDKPEDKPPRGGGGTGTFSDSDLEDVNQDGYKPDGGRSGGRAGPGYDQGGADQPQDPELLWGQILKNLYASMPEEAFMWISNLKQTLAPLLERVMDLLQALP